MRKDCRSGSIFGLVALLGVTLGMSLTANAQNDPFQITEAPFKSPKIDGDIGDWSDVSGFEMSWAHNERGGDPGNDPLEIEIKYAWDNDNFYTLITEISDDDPTSGINDADWCAECSNAAFEGAPAPAPWSTDSVGFYDQGVKWPGASDDPLDAQSLEVGPYTQYWVGLTGAEDLEIDGEKQYRHLVRGVNEGFNEGGTARLIGPRSEENTKSIPFVPDLPELTEPQSAFAVLPGDENGGRGRRVVEFFMAWDQIRYDAEDPRDEVQERLEELEIGGVEGHTLQDVKEGYEFRLEPLLVDGIDDFSFGSQTHPSGVEHPNPNHAFEWEHLSVVRLVGGATPGDIDGDGDCDADDIEALAAGIRAGATDAKFDSNGDGTVDSKDLGHYVEATKGTWIGDSNLDGEFNSSDFVAVFAAGEYEDAEDGNSTWAEGDWNGDGDFNSSDFVAAFSSGGYEKGPRPEAALVPEPSGVILLLLGLLHLRRRIG